MNATRAAGGRLRLGGPLVTVIVVAVVAIGLGVAALFLDKDTAGKATVEAGARIPAVGSVPPAFSVLTPEGKTVKLSDYAGKRCG